MKPYITEERARHFLTRYIETKRENTGIDETKKERLEMMQNNNNDNNMFQPRVICRYICISYKVDLVFLVKTSFLLAFEKKINHKMNQWNHEKKY